MRNIVLSAIACLLVATIAEARITVTTSHTGSVNQIVYDNNDNVLLTAGADGKVKVWRQTDGAVMHSFQVATVPVVLLAHRPGSTQFASVSTDGTSTFRLSVWDWQTEQLVFERELTEVPLFLGYSPGGTYLLFTKPQFSSVTVLSAANGRELPYLRRGFGIVSYAVVSGSEKRIMTYIPATGTITYYDISTGREIQSAQAPPGLEHLSLLPSKRYAAGVRGNTLYVVDVLQGETRATAAVGRVTSLSVDEDQGRIALGTSGDGGDEIHVYNYSNGSLFRLPYLDSRVTGSLSSLLVWNGTLFAGAKDGTLYKRADSDNALTEYAGATVSPVSGIAFGEDTLFLATPESVLGLTSDFFAPSNSAIPDITRLDERSLRNPLGQPARMASYLDQTIFLWNYTGRTNSVFLYNPTTHTFSRFPQTLTSPILSIRPYDGVVLMLQADGTLRAVNPSTFEADFTYTALGLETVVGTDTHGIIAGKNRANTFESSLIRINPETEETVRVPNDNFIVFDLAYDEREDTLYSLGLEKTDGGSRTTFDLHRGRDLESKRLILGVDGEDLNANIAVDSADDLVYTTLGSSGVYVWDGRQLRTLADINHIPHYVYSHNQLVFTLNMDGTLSVWSKETREHLMDVYVFRDGSWAAITASGQFYASSNEAERHLTYFPQRRVFQRSLNDLRLSLPMIN